MAVKTDWLGRPIKRAKKVERKRANTPRKLKNTLKTPKRKPK